MRRGVRDMLGVLTAALALPVRATLPQELSVSGGEVRTTEQGPVILRLSVDRAEINAAQQVRLSLSVAAEDGWVAVAPPIGEKLGGFTVASREEQPPELREGRLVTERRYTLEPFLPGDYTVPPLEIGYSKVGGGGSGTASTEPLLVRVVSLLPEDAKLDPGPIRGVVSPGAPARWVLPVALGLLSLCLAAGTAGVVVARRRRRVPAEDIGAALDQLRQELPARGAREVCDRATGLLRRALEARLPGALAMTSDQMLGAAHTFPITAHEMDRLRRFLEVCDAVRFAGAEGDAAELDEDLVALAGIARAFTANAAGDGRP